MTSSCSFIRQIYIYIYIYIHTHTHTHTHIPNCTCCHIPNEDNFPFAFVGLIEKISIIFYVFFYRVSLYNVVNKANLVHNLSLAYLFLVPLSISACFGRLFAHHQEKQLRLFDAWCLLACVDDCLVCRVEWSFHSTLHTRHHLVCRVEWSFHSTLHTRHQTH